MHASIASLHSACKSSTPDQPPRLPEGFMAICSVSIAVSLQVDTIQAPKRGFRGLAATSLPIPLEAIWLSLR